MTKPTFKQYLEESKQQLKEAATATPVASRVYRVKSYCKLPIINEDEKEHVSLKPKQKLIVEWIYNDLKNPTLSCVSFKDHGILKEEMEFNITWSSEKFQTWLDKNTISE